MDISENLEKGKEVHTLIYYLKDNINPLYSLSDFLSLVHSTNRYIYDCEYTYKYVRRFSWGVSEL